MCECGANKYPRAAGIRSGDLAASQGGFTGEADGRRQLDSVGFLLWRAVLGTVSGKLGERKKDREKFRL